MLLTLVAHSIPFIHKPQRPLNLLLQTTNFLALSFSCFLIARHKYWVELCWKILAVEELLCELVGEEVNEQGLPPGFRFHPTDEELVTFYLASKVFHGNFCGVEIAEVDLNRCEPWELPDVAKMGEREWYFFSLRDRKYPSGLRTNRATGAGYWKATGKDREVYSASTGALLGMKKTLVFYKGRAPRGEKTKWVMHEYRLDGDFSCRPSCKEEWVICRIFNKKGEKKNALAQRQSYMMAVSSSSTTFLPPVLETPGPASFLESQTLMQAPNSYLIPSQENDLKSLINPVAPQSQSRHFPTNGFLSATSIFTNSSTSDKHAKTNANNSSASMLFKSLLSHQGCISKEQATILKQCKTEANFSHSDANATLNWMDKIHPNPPCQNPLLFEMDYTVLGFSEGAVTGHDKSTSMMILNPPATASGESWPLDC